jgi:hypothetical protein
VTDKKLTPQEEAARRFANNHYLPPELAAQLLKNPEAKVVRSANLALCRCKECERYLSKERAADGSEPQFCVDCQANAYYTQGMWSDQPDGLPLAKIRGPENLTPLQIEQLGLFTEEAGEVSQRVGKILRWGLDADFDGTSQTHKLEVELGDELAIMILGQHNGLIDLDNVIEHAREKLEKLRVDAAGPKQRLRHAKVPEKHQVFLDVFVTEDGK